MRLINVPITSLLVSLSATGIAAPNYVASVIEFGEQVQAISVGDINGDGRDDLVISNWNEDLGRELWLYWQQADGKFPAKPSQRVEIKRDIVAYAMADIREEAGDELLLFTALSVFSYSATRDSYTGNLQKLADWTFVSAVPSRQSTPYLGRFTDQDNDGNIDILIPGEETFGVLSVTKRNKDNTELVSVLPLPVAEHRIQGADPEGGVSVNMQDGIKIEVTRPSYFAGLVVERLVKQEPEKDKEEETDFARYADPGALLSLERWIDNVEAAQITPDPQAEFVFIDEDPELDAKAAKKQRINIVSIKDKKPAVIFQASIEPRDEIRLFDFNDDNLKDLLLVQRRGSDDVTANFYVNRAGHFNLDKADQVIKFTGYDVNFRFSDINNDKRSDLVVGAYQISALGALREGALVRISLIYQGNANYSLDGEHDLFNRRPDFKLEENFSADDIKGLTQPVDYGLDLDGDGNKDAISIDKRGAIIARTMNKQFQLQSQTAWEFVPLRFIQRVQDHNLNNDQRPDFILHHQEGITVLVSRQ